MLNILLQADVVCPPPPLADNARVYVYRVLIGSAAVYTCFTGFEFLGSGVSRTVFCTNGTWILTKVVDCQGYTLRTLLY